MKRLRFSVRAFASTLVTALLVGCAGVPFMTLVKFATFHPADIMNGNASEMAVAFDVDQRVRFPTDYHPTLDVTVEPETGSDFQPFVRKLVFVMDASPAARPGLKDSKPGRHWVVFRFNSESVKQHEALKAYVEAYKKRPNPKGGGTVNAFLYVPPMQEAFKDFEGGSVEAWVRISAKDGFYKFWSGVIGEKS